MQKELIAMSIFFIVFIMLKTLIKFTIATNSLFYCNGSDCNSKLVFGSF